MAEKASQERHDFLAAIQTASNGQYGALLAFLKRHNARTDEFSLGELCQALSKKDHERVWKGVLTFVRPIVEERRFLGEEDSDDDDEGEGEDDDGGSERNESVDEDADASMEDASNAATPLAGTGTPLPPSTSGGGGGGGGGGGAGNRAIARRDARAETAAAAAAARESERAVATSVEALGAAAALANVFIADASQPAPRPLLDAVQLMHGVLLFLDHGGGLQAAAVQAAVARCCEAWWLGGRPGADLLVAQLVPYVLMRALHADGKDADVKRAHALRGAVLLLDVDDPETGASLRGLLLRCFLSPLFLRCNEGRRFLAALFGLGPTFVDDAHAAARGQLLRARRPVLAAYGEVYFRAWGGADDIVARAKLEAGCVQDLMQACVHAASPALFENLMTVLAPFHDRRRQKGVDGALLRLYEPILWRALRCANPTVRAQACAMLGAAFPLQEPTAGAEAVEKILQRQFDAFRLLLEDGSPAVRTASAGAVCSVLAAYWEAIPLPTTRALLARVAGQLACDASSPAVRLAAARGLTTLLDCPPALPVLRAMLPGIAYLLHDTNARVRLAFVELLAGAKAAAGIGLFPVAPLPRLLAALAAEAAPCGGSPATASALVRLLLDLYFPQGPGVTGAQQVSRALALLAHDQAAARAFYGGLHRHVSVGSVVKMAAMLFKCVAVALAAQDDGEEGPGSGDGGGGGIGLEDVDANAAAKGAKMTTGKKGGRGGKRGPDPKVPASGMSAGVNENVEADEVAAGAPAKKKPAAKSRKRQEVEASGDEAGNAAAAAAPAPVATIGGASGGDAEASTGRLVASDALQMEGILTLVATLWESVEPRLAQPANAACLALLRSIATPEALRQCYDRFRAAPGPRAATLRVVALAGDDAVPLLMEDVVGELLSLPGTAPAARFAPIAALLCAWGQQEQLVAVVVDSLDAAFRNKGGAGGAGGAGGDCSGSSSGGGGGGNRGAEGGGRATKRGKRARGGAAITAKTAIAPVAPPPASPPLLGLHPRVALNLLSLILAGGDGSTGLAGTREAVLADGVATARIRHALEGLRAAVEQRLEQAVPAKGAFGSGDHDDAGSQCSDKLLVGAMHVQCRVLVHLDAAAAEADEEEAGGADVREEADDDNDDGGAAATDGTTGIERPGASLRALYEWAGSDVLAAALSGGGGTAKPSLAAEVFNTVAIVASDCVMLERNLNAIVALADASGDRLLDAMATATVAARAVAAPADAAKEEETEESSAFCAALDALVPALCRLLHQLALASLDGTSVVSPLWMVLLRAAGGNWSAKGGGMAATSVSKLIAASFGVYDRRGALEAHVGRLLTFIAAEATVVPAGSADDDGEDASGGSSDAFRELSVAPAAPLRVRLGAAAAVSLRAIIRSAAAAKAALTVCTQRLNDANGGADSGGNGGGGGGGSGGGSGDTGLQDVVAVHVVAALVTLAPPKTAAEMAVTVHKLLASRRLGSVDLDGNQPGSDAAGAAAGSGAAVADGAFDAAAALQALYGRLDAARQTALERPAAAAASAVAEAGMGTGAGAMAVVLESKA